MKASLGRFAGLALMAAAMAGVSETNPRLEDLNLGYKPGSTMRSNAILTNKQKKSRAKSKRAGKARKFNRL